MEKFTLKQALAINSNKDIYIENLSDLIAQEKMMFDMFSFYKNL